MCLALICYRIYKNLCSFSWNQQVSLQFHNMGGILCAFCRYWDKSAEMFEYLCFLDKFLNWSCRRSRTLVKQTNWKLRRITCRITSTHWTCQFSNNWRLFVLYTKRDWKITFVFDSSIRLNEWRLGEKKDGRMSFTFLYESMILELLFEKLDGEIFCLCCTILHLKPLSRVSLNISSCPCFTYKKQKKFMF